MGHEIELSTSKKDTGRKIYRFHFISCFINQNPHPAALGFKLTKL